LVFDAISTEDGAALELPQRTFGLELRVLLHTNGEDVSDVSSLAAGLSFTGHGPPLADVLLVPRIDLT
jgi:hypothetical protein